VVETTRFKLRSDDLAWRAVDEEIVVLDLRTSRYLNINPSGAALWPHLVEGASAAELVSVLVSAFELDEAAAARDVDAFLAMCTERDLVEAVAH
jgi:hypothetical protein